MENQDFKISIKTVWILVIGNPIFTILGAIAVVNHWELYQLLLTIGFILCFSTFVIVMSDIVKNKVYNKTFWIVSLFSFPSIAPVFYIIRRNKLIQHESKFGR